MEQSLRTVYIYGKLAADCGVKSIQLRGNTVAELVEGLSANFKEQLRPQVNKPRLVCRVKGFDTQESLYYDLGDLEEIHIFPALGGGGGDNGFFKIIIGFIILAVAIFAPYLLPALAPLFATLAPTLIAVGAGMIIGGIMQLTMPQPEVGTGSGEQIEASKYLGATANTVRIGTSIPILLGRSKVFGHIFSFNVDAVDVAT